MTFDIKEEAQKEYEASMARARERAARQAPRLPFFRAGLGTSTVRIMPPAHDNSWYLQRGTHWVTTEDGKKKPVTCLHQTPSLKDDCVVCERRDFLARLGKSTQDQEVLAEAKSLFPQISYALLIVDTKDPVYKASDIKALKEKLAEGDTLPFNVGDTKFQVFDVREKVMNSLRKVLIEGEDFTDLETGFLVDIVGVPANNPKYTDISVSVHRRPSAFEITGEIPDLKTTIWRPTPEYLAKVLPGLATAPENLGSGEEEQEEDDMDTLMGALPASFGGPADRAAAGAVDLEKSLAAEFANRKASK